jgi:cytochrome P450
VSEFPKASLLEGIRFTAQIAVPGVIQGLFVKRALPTRLAAVAHADQLGYQLVEGMVRRLGPDPIALKVGKDDALLVHSPGDIQFVLDGSPSPFAADPDAKRKGMSAFQPDALTISRGDLWQDRRRFAEAVLDTGAPLHRLAPRMTEVALDEARGLVGAGTLRWPQINAAFQRLTRRVVLGESAADDTAITEQLAELMSAANRMPGKPAAGYDRFIARVQDYVDRAEPGSLCGLVAEAPQDEATKPAGQIVHWLFAMGDTLAANVFRALALLATHPEQLREVRAQLAGADLAEPKAVAAQEYLAGCILEAMRLWPTTALFGRVAIQDVTFPSGAVLPAGRQVFIYNLFNHRNRDRIPFADRFAPGEWVSGDAGKDWSFNFFSHGPQGCPGAGMALFLGQAVTGHVVSTHTPLLSGASLDPRKRLPYALDIYSVAIDLSPAR